MSCVCLQVDETVLENVTHDDAVGALKATSKHVRLVVAKPNFVPLDGGEPASQPDSECYTSTCNSVACSSMGSLYKT